MSEIQFAHPFGQLQLRRWPRRRNELLRAWDSADLYLLNTLAEQQEQQGTRTLVVNDQCGALWLAASQHGEAFSSGDSFMAQQAALANATDNQLPITEQHWYWPGQTLPQVDRVLLRVPKELALLERQLLQLSRDLPAGTPLWLAGMDKHLPRQLLSLLQRTLGNGQAGLGWKKARIFTAQLPGASSVTADALARTSSQIRVDSLGWDLLNHAGVFSQQQLDIGARLFLSALPAAGEISTAAPRVADLGCGNGVIGMAMLAAQPDCQLTFCDESWLALESARDNVARYFPQHSCQFHLGDGLVGLEQPFDLVLLNPPFHHGHVVGDHIARRLFRQAHQALRPGGELRVVANRHLGYLRPLSRLFASVAVVSSNAKFVVWRCLKQAD